MSNHTEEGNSSEFQDDKPSHNNLLVREYEVLKNILNLHTPVIFYPACGTDISLVRVWPDSETYYVDTDERAIKAMRDSGLMPETSHLINGSAYDFHPPKPVDLVVIKDASVEGDTLGLIKGLRDGGYVIESAWGSTGRARELLSDPNYALVGMMHSKTKKGEEGERVVLNTDVERIREMLEGDANLISRLPCRRYVFQKCGNVE